jgi:acetyl esterase
MAYERTSEAHPLVRPLLAEALRAPPLDVSAMSPGALRALLDAKVMQAPLPSLPLASVEDVTVDGGTGPLRLRIYRPDGARVQPWCMYLHGGGFMLGNLDTHDRLCRYLAARARVAIVAVDFRLSPEHPYPAAHDDCLAATMGVRASAATWGLDPDRFALAGESSGGHLALATAWAMHARGQLAPAALVLLYPLVEMTTTHPAYEQFGQGYLLTRKRMDFYLGAYLQSADPGQERLSMLRAARTFPIPPTHVMTAGLDPTSGDALTLCQLLRERGALLGHEHYEGWPHGFLFWGHAEGGLRALDSAGDALASRLHG